MIESEPPESVEASLAAALEPDFELVRLLGRGRTAHVFLAREASLSRLVSVKVLRPEHGKSEAKRLRFEREARLAATIKHPLVPAVHRVGRAPSGLPFIVQEFVDGRTVRDRLEASGAMRPDEVRSVLTDLAEALAAAHDKGVIHRDIRPGNLLIEDGTGRAHLTDFGLSAARDAGEGASRLTRTGEVIGDPKYVSPEQLEGAAVTAQTDVYSIGILGYEMLTCANPFGSQSTQELLAAHQRGEPLDLPWSVSTQDPGLGALLRRCLNKDPARRPKAREVAEELGRGRGLAGSPAGGGPPESSVLAAFPGIESFLAELRRRRVYHVVVAYLVGAFVLLQVADLLLQGTTAEPEWLYPGLVAVVVTGLPVAIVLSWIYELTGGRIRKTDPVGEGSSTAVRALGIGAATLLAVLAGWLLTR